MVGVPKYYKLQTKMLPGSADGSSDQARPLSKTVRTPTAKAVWGERKGVISETIKTICRDLYFLIGKQI